MGIKINELSPIKWQIQFVIDKSVCIKQVSYLVFLAILNESTWISHHRF